MNDENLPEGLVETTLSLPFMAFNAQIHEVDEAGDPVRKPDMGIRLKKNWKKTARDRQDREYNPHIHGDKPQLDEKGFLKVRRREANGANFSSSRSKAFVAKFQKAGYHYYLANDLGGVPEKMEAKGYEVVRDGDGAAKMAVGATRQENTQATLYRIPIEWYEANQREKRKMNDETLKQVSAPKVEDGQYEVNAKSSLR